MVMRRSFRCALAHLVIVLASPGDARAEKACSNPIVVLGGETAVVRKPEIGTAEKLREALNKECVPKQDCFKQALKDALAADGKSDLYEPLFAALNKASDDDRKPVAVGTELEWMAFRRTSDRKVQLGRHACWQGKAPFDAWYTNVSDGTVLRTFIVPTDCFNLALLKDLPPTCDIQATVSCATNTANVHVAARAPEKENILSVTLRGAKQGGAELEILPGKQENGQHRFDNIKLPEAGDYNFTATATASNGLASECSTAVSLCEKPAYKPCPAPSCKLSLTWPPAGKLGDSLIIAYDIKDNETAKLCIQRPSDAECIDTQCTDGRCSVAVDRYGIYQGKLTVTAPERNDCQPPPQSATCTASFELREVEEEIVKPCCVTPWFLRAFGGYAVGLGSEQTGLFRLSQTEIGTFKVDFNQGLAFGVEVEGRFTGLGPDGQLDDGWGWKAGLTYANLDTVWIFDSSRRWLRDHDRVPALLLTTGPSYHWRLDDWDLHAGPLLGLASFENGSYADGSDIPGVFDLDFGESLAFGAGLGVDWSRGEKQCWGFSFGVDYLRIEADAGDFDLDVDPLIAKAGFFYRF